MTAGALWRLTLVLGLGGAAVLAAGTWFFSEPSGPGGLGLPGSLATRERAAGTTMSPGRQNQATRSEANARTEAAKLGAAVAPPAAAASGNATPADAAAARAAEPPRFDVVRIGARGTAVVAGRAEPGTEVVLLEDGREIGRARADARGEWVILPASPLQPGSRQLTLVARRAGGEEVAGPDTVVVVVADPSETQSQQAAASPQAPTATRQPGSPLVVLVPGAAAGAASSGAPAPLPRVLQGGAPPGAADPALPTAPGSGRLALDVVDYDETGAIRFAGSAAPGSAVRIYVDDQHVGDATADAQGRWLFAPSRVVAAGRHRLRVDQLAASGSVAARVELPFLREQVADASLRGMRGSVVVQPGHSLWRIARESYGRGMQVTLIYEANRSQIRNPDLIYPGQVFSVPVSN
jgi:hypothetical protein